MLSYITKENVYQDNIVIFWFENKHPDLLGDTVGVAYHNEDETLRVLDFEGHPVDDEELESEILDMCLISDEMLDSFT